MKKLFSTLALCAIALTTLSSCDLFKPEEEKIGTPNYAASKLTPSQHQEKLHKSSIAGTFIIIRTFPEMSRSIFKNFEIFDEVILPRKVASYSSQGKGFPASTWSFR